MDPALVDLLGCPAPSGHPTLPVPSVAAHLIQVAIVVVAVAVADRVLQAGRAWRSSGARWFCLHSLVNAAITALAWPDLLFTVVKPMCSMVVRVHPVHSTYSADRV